MSEKPTLYLLRGLPGSGKSTLAKTMKAVHLEADMYFCRAAGQYQFDATKLQAAHRWCLQVTETMLARGESVVVSNTFTRQWELEPYRIMAARLGVPCLEFTINAHLTVDELVSRNQHGVSRETIQAMKDRWEA